MTYTQKPRGLPTQEMKLLTDEQKRDYREHVRKYGPPQEESLPEGCSLTSPRVMSLAFRSLVLSGVIC